MFGGRILSLAVSRLVVLLLPGRVVLTPSGAAHFWQCCCSAGPCKSVPAVPPPLSVAVCDMILLGRLLLRPPLPQLPHPCYKAT